MRRNVRDRLAALAPFVTYESDPYIVVGDDGQLSWMMDAFTTSDSYPCSSHYALGGNSILIPRTQSSPRTTKCFLPCSRMPLLCRQCCENTYVIPSCCSSCRRLSTAFIT
jgi:hypothetical protein